MSNEADKDTLMKILYDLESALKSKKDEKGNRVYDNEYIDSILKKIENLYDKKTLKLVKKTK